MTKVVGIIPGKSDAQKRAQKEYMKDIARVEITMHKEKRRRLQEYADRKGEKSINAFINRLLDEALEREKE